MRKLLILVCCIMLALFVIGVAIFSVQNATPVSLKMLGWQSIDLPVGIVLAMGMGGGMMTGALLQWVVLGSDQKW